MWLDVREFYRHGNVVLTKRTPTALRLAAYLLSEFAKLGQKYLLQGKIQTDCLEARFGRYRQMAGGHYHISVCQLYETEGMVRLRNTLTVMSANSVRDIENANNASDASTSDNVTVKNADLVGSNVQVSAIAYIDSYCMHAVLKVLKCKENKVQGM